jgi:hypothetical protein
MASYGLVKGTKMKTSNPYRLSNPITQRNRADVLDATGKVIGELFVSRPRHGWGGGRTTYRVFVGGELVASGETIKSTLANIPKVEV